MVIYHSSLVGSKRSEQITIIPCTRILERPKAIIFVLVSALTNSVNSYKGIDTVAMQAALSNMFCFHCHWETRGTYSFLNRETIYFMENIFFTFHGDSFSRRYFVFRKASIKSQNLSPFVRKAINIISISVPFYGLGNHFVGGFRTQSTFYDQRKFNFHTGSGRR